MQNKKLKNNKGPAPHHFSKSGAGFVILFAVTLSSILLAIAIGVANIALKEVKFSTSARDTNDAFFAGDTGIEYALFNDKPPSAYVPNPGTQQTWNLVIYGLGSAGTSCSKVTIVKDNTVQPYTSTNITAKGYNIGDASCVSTNSNRIEREIKASYGGGGAPVNQNPIANAGPDKAITLPTSSSAPTGTSANDPDGTISSTIWSFFSGPTTPNIANGSTLTPSFTNMTLAGTYIFRLTATDNQGAIGVDEMSVVASDTNAVPTVTTPTVSAITTTGATLGANVTSLGVPASISARGTCWGTTAAPTTNCVAEGGTSTGVFTHARTGMAASTFYYYRGYATNTTGTGYSADGTFTTTAPSSNFARYRQITVNSGQVSAGPLTNFPVLVNFTNASLISKSNGGPFVENSNGYDIIFASDSAGATPLTWEMESYNPVTGSVVAWVKIPSLNTGSIFYMLYGKTGISTFQSTASAVWDSNYKIVAHLPNGTTLTKLDSTSNGNHGTSGSSLPSATTGKIGGGAYFSGPWYIYIDFPSSGTFTNFTISEWLNPADHNYYRIFFANSVAGGLASFGGDLYLYWPGGNTVVGAPTGNWEYWVYTQSGSTISIYKNASLVATSGAGAPVTPTFWELSGYAQGVNAFKGPADEARVSNIVRPASWMITEYNNQNNPSAFYTMGAEQTP